MKSIKEKLRVAAIPVSTAIMMAPATISAFASEVGAGAGDAVSIDLQTIANDAMTQIKGDMMVVIAASTAASVVLVSVTVGIAYMLKRAKGLKNVG